jgi:hypothetical protein
VSLVATFVLVALATPYYAAVSFTVLFGSGPNPDWPTLTAVAVAYALPGTVAAVALDPAAPLDVLWSVAFTVLAALTLHNPEIVPSTKDGTTNDRRLFYRFVSKIPEGENNPMELRAFALIVLAISVYTTANALLATPDAPLAIGNAPGLSGLP